MTKISFISMLVSASMICLLSCSSSRSANEIKSVINNLKKECPIKYKCFGEITDFKCDVDQKTIMLDFKLNSEYMTVSDFTNAFSQDIKVRAAVDIVKHSESNTYIKWAEEGYSVALSIYDDVSSNKWDHLYTPDYMNSTKADIDHITGQTLAELIAFNYANTVLSQELPKETQGPWKIDRISTENNYIDIYYQCTDANADDPDYFNIFTVDGEDDQKMLGGNYELTNMEMSKAFREGKTVRVGGEPLFALDFLYKCEVPAKYHFEPLCTITINENH